MRATEQCINAPSLDDSVTPRSVSSSTVGVHAPRTHFLRLKRKSTNVLGHPSSA